MMSFSQMHIVIRTDASRHIGTGHVFRCLALADELRLSGAKVSFICRIAPGHLGKIIRNKDYPVYFIADVKHWQEDAEATAETLLSLSAPVDWLIVDHYELDVRWEEVVGPLARCIAAVDDLADRHHSVDLLIDSSHMPDEAGIYCTLLSSGTRLALGPDYVLLRREFFERTPPKRVSCVVRRILVTFGGNDPLNATGLALDALDHPDFDGIKIDLTLGLSNPRLATLQDKAATMPNVAVHIQSSQMADLMMRADLCLGAGGTTSWERCYMRLPSLVLLLARNQCEFAARLERIGCVRNLGFADLLDAATLRVALLDAINSSDWRTRASRAAEGLIDGRGGERVMQHLKEIFLRKLAMGVSCR
jgi:UDP-2,4-diacetamido-2,4,6-trideoxy-beta-L-altropyranose hydrolase